MAAVLRIAVVILGCLAAAMVLPADVDAQPRTPRGMEWVSFASAPVLPGQAAETLSGLLARPAREGPWPAAVLMHGCSGMLTGSGALMARFTEWANLLRDEGYVVLLVDSFNPRGFNEECTRYPQPVSSITVRPGDARGALAYLQEQPLVDPMRVALIGWSHGGNATLATILWALSASRPPVALPLDRPWFRAAVAFYPGCVSASRPARVASSAPLLILTGEADDWTPAEPCHQLEARAADSPQTVAFKFYDGAYHAFDGPNAPLRVRRDVPNANGGRGVHIGTDAAARADALEAVPAFLARYLSWD